MDKVKDFATHMMPNTQHSQSSFELIQYSNEISDCLFLNLIKKVELF
ncbi:hypothetical protein MPQ_2146 [Methylovorus sp. MP688]|nr:hypothetical protein MPQ_2146 [Methylovorus sp. MP688]